MSLTIKVLDFISRRSKPTIWLLVLVGVCVLGAVDYLTGSSVSIIFFYLLPLSVASWSLGKTSGRAVALLSAIVTQAGPFIEQGSAAGVPLVLWNLAVRLAVFVVVVDLVSEFHRQLAHRTELSRTDPLTGTLNRRAFLEDGEMALANMRRQPAPMTLAFLDVDNFKAVNDAYGHGTGDLLLIAVAGCLKSQLWGSDSVARLGGDEFGLILPNTDMSAAQKVMPRLRDHLLSEMSVAHWPVTFSIGVVTCTAPAPDIEQIVHLADQLMYAAKHGGKDRIEYGSYPEMLSASRREAAERVLELQ